MIQFQIVQFRGEFFYYVGSTSWNDFSYYSYGKLFHRRGICHSGENLVVVFALATVVFKFCADRWSHSTYVFLGHVYKHEHQILLCEESIQIHEKALSQIIIFRATNKNILY